MTAAIGRESGGAFFSNLVIVSLLALAVGLYLQIVMVEPGKAVGEPMQAASVRIVEQPYDDMAGETQGLVPLPADQLQLIKQVFAPELL